MIPSDENEDLWKLLGKARSPVVSPFFARNVVRAVRGARQEHPGFLAILRRHWRLTATTAIAGCILAVTVSQFIGTDSHKRQIDSLVAMTEQVSESPDFYVINDLDDLLASEESSVWLDNSVH